VLSSSPNRANCVNNKARRQMIAATNSRFARSTTAESLAFSEQLGPGGAMNCTVDPAAAEKCGVRSVNDGIHVELCDIAAERFDLTHNSLMQRHPGWAT
jgi:hypothetical protein